MHKNNSSSNFSLSKNSQPEEVGVRQDFLPFSRESGLRQEKRRRQQANILAHLFWLIFHEEKSDDLGPVLTPPSRLLLLSSFYGFIASRNQNNKSHKSLLYLRLSRFKLLHGYAK
jgi:hypothetical protein